MTARVLPIVVLLALTGPARAETGVTATQVLLGQPAVFSGASAGLGVEAWRGSIAAFAESADAGGVHGRRVRVALADDGYEADRAIPAVLRLLRHDRVFALFQGVGTPTIVKTLPVVYRYYTAEGLFYFANLTGAQPQREPPYSAAVFNVRASYRQEMQAQVDLLVRTGRRRIGIYVQDDAYGTSGRDGVQRALAGHGLEVAAEVSYPRGMRFEISTQEQVQLLRSAQVDAVISVCVYQACAALIRDARRAGWNVPIHNLSFSGADQMHELLRAEERRSGVKMTRNLVNTAVVPSYEDSNVPLVRAYRAAIDRYQPIIPIGVGDGSYKPAAPYSSGSLEGYLDARVFLEVLKRNGPALTRESFYKTAESMGEFDVGLGVPLRFGPDHHQALDTIWFSYATPEGWRTVDDPATALE